MHKRKYAIALAICAAGVTIDQVTKSLINASLSPLRQVTVIPGFIELHYAQNTGMAFGLFPNIPAEWRVPFFSLVTFFAVAIIFHLLRQAPALALRFPAALGLILSGAFGNLIDRFRWRYVVDFIKVYYNPPNGYWPIFNAADIFISVGIGLLILDTFLARDDEAEEEDGEAESAGEEEASAVDDAGLGAEGGGESEEDGDDNPDGGRDDEQRAREQTAPEGGEA